MSMALGADDPAFQRFLQRVWKSDIVPLLRDRHARQRRRTARAGGTLAGSAGLVLDRVFGLRGKPFARFMTVMGSSLGAMLPDAWDWRWLERAPAPERDTVERRVAAGAAALPDREALALFGLAPDATLADLKAAWREASQRWHPDKARSEAQRHEFHLRFVALRAAYEHLLSAFDSSSETE